MDETVTSRRPKRSTAGNRLQAALAEFKAEDVGMDVEDDVDFVLDKDEEDMFWQDFESTDEEGDQDDVDATAENMLRQEEHRARKTARTHLERITALAHARQAATFNPELIAPEEKKAEKRIRRRVSIGVAVNAETGEVTPLEPEADAENSASAALGRRHSTRTHTVANTSATEIRAKDEVERKQSSAPKRVKSKTKAPTQEELIARALDMEEGNIEEHRNYLTIEEEKRRKARVVRTSVNGPLLRWISKAEEITVQIDPDPIPPPKQPPIPPPPVYPTHYPAAPPIPTGAPGYSYAPPTTAYLPSPQSSPFQQWPPPQPPVMYQPLPPLPPPPPPPPPPEPIIRKEKVAKQYAVHELEQVEKATRPTWSNTMTAMFGDHADWEHMRVYTTKGRPLARPTQICPITGRPARYLDPRTNVPYADLEAYRVLSGVLRHEYVWSPILGCYVAREGSVFSNSDP